MKNESNMIEVKFLVEVMFNSKFLVEIKFDQNGEVKFWQKKLLSKVLVKCLSKIKSFSKKMNVCQKSQVLVRKLIFVKNQKFWLKNEFLSKIKNFSKKMNVYQKSKVWLKK